jgi:hypothetical protein
MTFDGKPYVSPELERLVALVRADERAAPATNDFWEGYVPEPTRPAPMTTDRALDLALEALEYIYEGANNQGPHTGISWRCVAVKAEPAITAIKQARSAPVQEPLEYWNAVEGWVKIDEVREHFDSVGCGTIYKTAGDGRVPLTAAQRQWTGLTDEEIEKACVPLGAAMLSFTEVARAIEAKLKEKNNG